MTRADKENIHLAESRSRATDCFAVFTSIGQVGRVDRDGRGDVAGAGAQVEAALHPEGRSVPRRPAHIFLHNTPTHASWLNQVELFFSILQRRVRKGGELGSVDDLATRVIAFINDYTAGPPRSAGPTTAAHSRSRKSQ
jgi:hypothetical protein